jgi:uncharacterized protein (DUF1697 family)
MAASRLFPLLVALLVIMLVSGQDLAQTQTQSPPPPQTETQTETCSPDHTIIYQRAVALLDKAEKRLADKYTAEAKALVKEANSLFAILAKECAPNQAERELSDKELQQEAVNQKLCEDALSQAERLIKSAEEKEKKSEAAEAKGDADLSISYQRQAKGEYEGAQVLAVKAGIYALRNQQMIFRFLNR